jgi:hypothetical protein
MANQAWQANRVALSGRPGYDTVDEFGHITRKAADRKAAPRPVKPGVSGQRASTARGSVKPRPRRRPEQENDQGFDR